MDGKKEASIDRIQGLQINDWLRQADKFIREGRYLAADEYLQKVFAVDPEHEVGHSYQDRIEFLVRQLSQRVGLSKDIHTEIRQYRDRLQGRKPKEVGSLLVAAQKYLDEGLFQKAEERIGKVIALDPENMYAKALIQRMNELEQKAGSAHIRTKQELEFSTILKESWREGTPSTAQGEIIAKSQHDLGISEARRLEIEREIRNAHYLEALKNIWHTGGLAAFTNESVDQLRTKFQVSRIDHSFIETSLLREMRKNRIKGTILLMEGDEQELLELTRILRSNFFAIFSASSYDEALAGVRTAVPDIVISAILFNERQAGLDLFQTLRANPLTKHVPFIFLSKEIDRTTLLIGKRMGVEEFLEKPVDEELLVATVEGALMRSQKPAEDKVKGAGRK